jgi:hypothetical protein
MHIQEKGHVYVVINMGSILTHGHVYGVYSTREIAEAKARSERLKSLFDDDEGYVAVLKKSIEGPTLKNHTIVENDEVALVSVKK